MKKKISIILILLTSLFFILFFPNILKAEESTTQKVADLESYNIRDDYAIFSEDQDGYGLCWSFATNKALETTILKKTNQLFNFSEAYNGFARGGEFGQGGNYTYIIHSLSYHNGGLILEQDLEYLFSYYFLSNTSKELYEKEAKKYKLDEFNNIFSIKSFNLTENNKAKDIIEKQRKEVKEHIYNKGGIYVIIDKYTLEDSKVEKRSYFKDSNDDAPHAITIIGWDDNFEKIKGENKGAWVILNSNNEHNNASTAYLCHMMQNQSEKQ